MGLIMKKIYILSFFYFIFSSPVNSTFASSNNAEDHVAYFYIWYISEYLKLNNPMDNEIIYEYVNNCVVNNIRIFYEREYFDANYFTKTQDIWKEWLNGLVTHKSINIDGVISIVPISFKLSVDVQHQLVVFVQKEKDGFKIIKIVDTRIFE